MSEHSFVTVDSNDDPSIEQFIEEQEPVVSHPVQPTDLELYGPTGVVPSKSIRLSNNHAISMSFDHNCLALNVDGKINLSEGQYTYLLSDSSRVLAGEDLR